MIIINFFQQCKFPWYIKIVKIFQLLFLGTKVWVSPLKDLAFTVTLPSTLGAPTITDPLEFSLTSDLTAASPVFTLTCISTGGLATTVTWTRDGAAATGVISQTVTNMLTATYVNTLTVTGRLPGNYQCKVWPITEVLTTKSRTVAGTVQVMWIMVLWLYTRN